MKRVHSLNRINELMSRFVTQVKGAGSMSRTDITPFAAEEYVSRCDSEALPPCGTNPVTKLAYQWFWDDLKRVAWVSGELHGSDVAYWHPVKQSYRSGMD